MCKFWFLVNLHLAVTKEKKNNRFIGFSMGLFIVAGAYGADAVSVGCFNLAVAFGIEAATIQLGCIGPPPTPKDC